MTINIIYLTFHFCIWQSCSWLILNWLFPWNTAVFIILMLCFYWNIFFHAFFQLLDFYLAWTLTFTWIWWFTYYLGWSWYVILLFFNFFFFKKSQLVWTILVFHSKIFKILKLMFNLLSTLLIIEILMLLKVFIWINFQLNIILLADRRYFKIITAFLLFHINLILKLKIDLIGIYRIAHGYALISRN